MSLGDDLRISNALFGLKGSNAEQIFRNLSWSIARDTGLAAPLVYAEMIRAKGNKTIGIGDGVAVIDWMSSGISKPYILIAQLETPTNLNLFDDMPEDFVLILISPDTESVTHLRRLSRLSRLFHTSSLLRQLRSVTNADGMMAVLSSGEIPFVEAA